MQLSITTDYGIRVVLYLIKHRQIVKSTKLSEELNIPKNYILKVTKKLEEAGIVNIYQGVNGDKNKKRYSRDNIMGCDFSFGNYNSNQQMFRKRRMLYEGK